MAALAATGRTNREIAATMFVSPKTVEARLASVYGKLRDPVAGGARRALHGGAKRRSRDGRKRGPRREFVQGIARFPEVPYPLT